MKIPNDSRSLGSIRALDRLHRVLIPKEMLRELGWEVESGSRILIAELWPIGRVRLHDAGTTKERLVRLQEEAAALGAGESEDALRALHDRYREVKLYPEGRVHLSEAVHVALDDDLRPISVMVELRGNGVEVLSLAARNERLRRFGQILSIED